MERLKIALVHLAVRHGDSSANCSELLSLNTAAAKNGADIIVNTELGLSGYSFRSREEIASLVETVHGPAIQALTGIACRYRCYIVLGYAEEDPMTGIFYNSAAVIGPEGQLVLNYRKVTAEVRWACPGDPAAPNTFDTPWGRVGVAICSDTYYGTLARMTALRGADLLLVPANWPGGSLDPRELWQARVRENGFFLAACNRGGIDRGMSCEDAFSCVCSPDGEELFALSSCSSDVFQVEIPLTDGKLSSKVSARMCSRKPACYGAMYLDMRYATDMTSYYNLPRPAPLKVVCQTGDPEAMFSSEGLGSMMRSLGGEHPDLVILPAGACSEDSSMFEHLGNAAAEHNTAICAGISVSGDFSMLCAEKNGRVRTVSPGRDTHRFIDLEKARIALLEREELYHPEFAVALAKQGCDLVATSAISLDRHDRMVLGSRSIEQVAVAACSSGTAFICKPPVGHYRWEEFSTASPGCACTASLDIAELRNKNFFDRLAFDLLLKKQH